MNIAEITAKIRRDLKKHLPACKFSVTKSSHASGQRIDIVILSGDFDIYSSPENARNYIMTYKAERTIALIFAVARGYDGNDCNSMQNQFDVDSSVNVSFDHDYKVILSV